MNTQNVVLDSNVVTDILNKSKAFSQFKAKLRCKSIDIKLCGVELNKIGDI